MSWWRDVRRLAALSWGERRLLLEALIELARARWQLRTLPFNQLVAHLQRSAPAEPVAEPATGRITWSVRVLARRVPWRADCFPQAIAGYRMLQRRGRLARIDLGVRRAADGQLAGHAWLTHDDRVVLGGPGPEHFAPLHAISAQSAQNKAPHDDRAASAGA